MASIRIGAQNYQMALADLQAAEAGLLASCVSIANESNGVGICACVRLWNVRNGLVNGIFLISFPKYLEKTRDSMVSSVVLGHIIIYCL
jgi:hypothetical protein